MNKLKLLTTYLSKEKKITTPLGEFSYIKMIGQSANGFVGEFTLNEKPFAIKFLITEETGSSEITKRKRFIAEYLNVLTLPANRFVVQNIAFDILHFSNGNSELEIPFIIMKKYEGTLKLIQNAKNNREEFLKLFDFLTAALKFIHSQGIIHRDLKPENIFTNSQTYVVGDFGIAFYDPDRFSVKAITIKEKKERLGNRVFSAPEQETPKTDPTKTMDIYAMGQILQWFATSETHRGTGRKRIGKVYENVELYDQIIEKCIKHDPKERFQSVDEIIEFKKKLEEAENEKDPFLILEKFGDVLSKSFPKYKSDPYIVDDKSVIDRFFENLKKAQKELEGELWYSRKYSHWSFQVYKNPGDKWCLGTDEYEIEKLIVSYDSSTYNDFVIVKFKTAPEPFVVDGEQTYYAGLIDEKILISANELENRYAEINGKVVDLSKRKKKRMIIRQEEAGYFLICTKQNCAMQKDSDEKVMDFCNRLKENEQEALATIEEFKSDIRPNKPEYVKMHM